MKNNPIVESLARLGRWATFTGNHSLTAQVKEAEQVFETNCAFCDQRAILVKRGVRVCARHKRILEAIR